MISAAGFPRIRRFDQKLRNNAQAVRSAWLDFGA
jgi:hypothetical protein